MSSLPRMVDVSMTSKMKDLSTGVRVLECMLYMELFALSGINLDEKQELLAIQFLMNQQPSMVVGSIIFSSG